MLLLSLILLIYSNILIKLQQSSVNHLPLVATAEQLWVELTSLPGVVTLWSGFGPWGGIACPVHNAIGSHPGDCDCSMEPPPGTVLLLFQ